MLHKIKRQACLHQYPNFPQTNSPKEEFSYPPISASHILTLPSKSIKGHVKSLSTELTALIEALGLDSLTFLGDTKTAWRYQDNDYKPVKEALQYLADNNIGKRFNGALTVPLSELPQFIKHLFWLTRCNASLPTYYCMDNQQNFVGNICKYGNLHIDTLNKKTDRTLKDLISKSSFEYLSGIKCFNNFAKSGVLRNRQTII